MATVLVKAFGLLARGRRARVAAAVACGIAAAGLSIAQPVFFGKVVDALVAGQGSAGIAPVLTAFVGAALAFVAIDFANKLVSDRLAHTAVNEAMGAFAENALKLSQDYHTTVHSAWLAKTMGTGVDALFSLWLSTLRTTLPSLTTLLVMIPATLAMNWALGLLFLVLVVFFAAVSSRVVRKAMRAQDDIEAIKGKFFARTGDALANIKLVQAYNRVDGEIADLRALLDERLKRQMPVLRLWAFYSSLPDSAFALTFAGIFAVGATLVAEGRATVGEVVTFVTLAAGMVPRLGGIMVQVSDLIMKGALLRDFFDVLERRPSVGDPALPAALPASAAAPDGDPAPERVAGHIRFENVGFRYADGGAGVEGIDIDAGPGECVALVGQTGAGKTTLTNLLLRFTDPHEGRITLDGVDIRALPLDFLRAQIGVVFQEPFILNRSIADNLRVGAPGASDAELAEAARRAYADGFITRSPEGFCTLVGERGATLSGGERQRLSIARALLKNAPVLVLDEATSALDATTERLIQQSLDGLMRDRTTFVIAHRLATIKRADQILVLERGRIIERGTFATLVAQGGAFAALVAAQQLTAEAA